MASLFSIFLILTQADDDADNSFTHILATSCGADKNLFIEPGILKHLSMSGSPGLVVIGMKFVS